MKKLEVLILFTFLITIKTTAQNALSKSNGLDNVSKEISALNDVQVTNATNSSFPALSAAAVTPSYKVYVITNNPIEGIELRASNESNIKEVTLVTVNEQLGALSFELTDVFGKRIERQTIKGRQTLLDVSKLGMASYYLKIMSEQEMITSFKIVKK